MTEATGPGSQVHVCLVSDQLLPNLIPVLMHRPTEVHLVVTDDKAGEGRRFRRLLQDHGFAVAMHEGAPSTGTSRLEEYAMNVATNLDEHQQGRTIVLNATGGTKLMALAFLTVFRDDLGAHVIYTDTEHGQLEYLAPREVAAEPLRPVLNIPTYLAANGMTLRRADSQDHAWVSGAQKRKPLTKWLADQAASIGRFLGAMNRLAAGALDNHGMLTAPEQHFDSAPHGNRWTGALRQIRSTGLADWSDGDTLVRFADAAAARYLSGGWLEEYAWHVFRDEQPDDVMAGVVGTWESSNRASPSRNEFDLLVVHRNRMLVLECKTMRFGNSGQSDQDVMHKLATLGRNAGGLFGTTLLLSARPLNAALRSRAESNHIQILEGADIRKLRDYARDWMHSA